MSDLIQALALVVSIAKKDELDKFGIKQMHDHYYSQRKERAEMLKEKREKMLKEKSEKDSKKYGDDDEDK